MFSKRADWWCGMDLGPVEKIGAVWSTSACRVASDVLPAAGVEGAVRLKEDSYGGKRKGEERGLDQDEEVNEGAQESDESEVPLEASRRQLNFFV